MSRLAGGFAAILASAALTIGLAAGSVMVHRPVRRAVGSLCAPAGDDPSGMCFQRLPAGGWPFSFLYDNPGTSVLGQLGPEDDFKPGWFLLDAAIFGLLPTSGAVALRLRRRRARKPPDAY
jgi:hypothetical protein